MRRWLRQSIAPEQSLPAVGLEKMVKYFFHTYYREAYCQDERGVDLPDIATAKREAIMAAEEMVADLVAEGCHISDLGLEVTDENGNILLILPFRSLLN